MSLTGTVGKDDYGNVCILGNDYDVYYLNQRNAKLELQTSLDKGTQRKTTENELPSLTQCTA